jgi:muconate cycloisomerase
MSAPLRVTAIDRRTVTRPMPFRVGNGDHATTTRIAIEIDVRVESGDRVWLGRGSATPMPGYSIDTLVQTEAAFAEVGRALPWSFPGIGQLPEELAGRLAHLPPAARGAIETAILDAAGQISERPLWALLRAVVPPSLPVCAFLPPELDQLVARSEALCALGIVSQKWKLSDAAQIEVLARLPRDRVRLRIDANRTYTPEAFAAISGRLAALGPQYVEEPIGGDLAAWILGAPASALRELRFAVDESLAALRASDALAVLRRFSPAIAGGRLSTVVVKPARDGLLGALALGRAARAAGADVVVTHMFDGPRGHLAATHLAFALGVSDAQGLAAQPGLGDPREPAIAALYARLSTAQLVRPSEPGLGAVP